MAGPGYCARSWPPTFTPRRQAAAALDELDIGGPEARLRAIRAVMADRPRYIDLR